MYINKNEFTKGPVQDGLTEALGWCRDNNEHGKDIPGYHAAALLNAGIIFWDPEHEMYDIIEPIKSWLEPHKIESRFDTCAREGCDKMRNDISPEIPGGSYCSMECYLSSTASSMRLFGLGKADLNTKGKPK